MKYKIDAPRYLPNEEVPCGEYICSGCGNFIIKVNSVPYVLPECPYCKRITCYVKS